MRVENEDMGIEINIEMNKEVNDLNDNNIKREGWIDRNDKNNKDKDTQYKEGEGSKYSSKDSKDNIQ